MNYKEEIKQLSKELNLPEDIVYKVYMSYWIFIKELIASLPLKQSISEEEFNSMNTSISIPFIGKLHCDYTKWKHKKDNYNKIKKEEND